LFSYAFTICYRLFLSALLLVSNLDPTHLAHLQSNPTPERLTCAEHDFDAFANVLSGVKSLNVVLAVDILCTSIDEN